MADRRDQCGKARNYFVHAARPYFICPYTAFSRRLLRFRIYVLQNEHETHEENKRLQGRIQTRMIEKEEEKARQVTEVIGERVTFLSSGHKTKAKEKEE